jgi:superfamily I DNA/RNA helicase
MTCALRPVFEGNSEKSGQSLSGIEAGSLRLEKNKRTNHAPIINAATALRANQVSVKRVLEVFVAPMPRLRVSRRQGGETDSNESGCSTNAVEAIAHARDFARLRGLLTLDQDLLEHFADRVIHAKRAYARTSTRVTFTTVHGAKNKEFDHVFVVWDTSSKATSSNNVACYTTP